MTLLITRRGRDRATASASGLRQAEATYLRSKRQVDLIASTVLLALVVPLMALIGVAVRASGPGPILFRQRRLGLGGREFWCYKFRTMVPDADARLSENPELLARFEENFKIKDDPRVTRLGRFLRKTSLDELPQLYNVLRGDLSMIGPRPIVPHELVKYGEHARTLLSVKPGLGGPWQIYGRSDRPYHERVAMDIGYAREGSTLNDLKYAVLTAKALLFGRGAC